MMLNAAMIIKLYNFDGDYVYNALNYDLKDDYA